MEVSSVQMAAFILLLSPLLLAADACLRPPAAPAATTTSSAPKCIFYGPSSVVPNNVNQLRPGDIGIIGSIGDSDSAAFGARASTLLTITQVDNHHHHHGYPAYSHHDKIPPWWEYVSNDKGGNVSVTKSHHT